MSRRQDFNPRLVQRNVRGLARPLRGRLESEALFALGRYRDRADVGNRFETIWRRLRRVRDEHTKRVSRRRTRRMASADEKHGSEKTAERMVVEARTTKATTTTRSSSKGTIDVDYLAGASLGDVAAMSRAPGRRRTHRRTKRRSGWCKRLAVRLAMRGNGRFWCEFGELLSDDKKVGGTQIYTVQHK